MSAKLYRKTTDGLEALEPQTSAEAVRYGSGTVADVLADSLRTSAQTLTNEQKSLCRKNIDAQNALIVRSKAADAVTIAPGGFANFYISLGEDGKQALGVIGYMLGAHLLTAAACSLSGTDVFLRVHSFASVATSCAPVVQVLYQAR